MSPRQSLSRFHFHSQTANDTLWGRGCLQNYSALNLRVVTPEQLERFFVERRCKWTVRKGKSLHASACSLLRVASVCVRALDQNFTKLFQSFHSTEKKKKKKKKHLYTVNVIPDNAHDLVAVHGAEKSPSSNRISHTLSMSLLLLITVNSSIMIINHISVEPSC